jgi:uncharacterized protein (DUF3084 family)
MKDLIEKQIVLEKKRKIQAQKAKLNEQKEKATTNLQRIEMQIGDLHRQLRNAGLEKSEVQAEIQSVTSEIARFSQNASLIDIMDDLFVESEVLDLVEEDEEVYSFSVQPSQTTVGRTLNNSSGGFNSTTPTEKPAECKQN